MPTSLKTHCWPTRVTTTPTSTDPVVRVDSDGSLGDDELVSLSLVLVGVLTLDEVVPGPAPSSRGLSPDHGDQTSSTPVMTNAATAAMTTAIHGCGRGCG